MHMQFCKVKFNIISAFRMTWSSRVASVGSYIDLAGAVPSAGSASVNKTVILAYNNDKESR